MAPTRVLAALAVMISSLDAGAQQPLETETARLPLRRQMAVNGAYEFQTSSQGTEHALPFAIEYRLTNRLAVLVEPVFFTAIRPKIGARASGLGDLEITGQFLVGQERHALPAFALAAEVKVPTATNSLIGTRRADFTPYLIASKSFGSVELHANIGYSFMGQPPNIQVQNTLNLALAVEQHVTPRLDLMAELLSTSASIAGGEGTIDPNAPELAGAEQVGMAGVRYRHGSRTWLSLAVTYDNTNAVLLRPGITIVIP